MMMLIITEKIRLIINDCGTMADRIYPCTVYCSTTTGSDIDNPEGFHLEILNETED